MYTRCTENHNSTYNETGKIGLWNLTLCHDTSMRQIEKLELRCTTAPSPVPYRTMPNRR